MREIFHNANFISNFIVQWLTLIVLIITAVIAFRIGNTQNQINKKIEKLQDSVEVFSYPISGVQNTNQPQKGFPWLLRVVNVGSVQLYITEYIINGYSTVLNNALLPAGQQQNAWYQIPLPIPTSTTTTINVTIKIDDKFGRTWQSITDIGYRNNEWESLTHEIQLLSQSSY